MVEDRLVWIDLEMTGLDPDENTIIEIATIVTEGDLSIVAEGPSFAISVSEEELERVRSSKITMSEAENQTLDFLQLHCLAGVPPLCGNTIGQDRRFLRRYMPNLHSFFHYRSVDVTSVKELVRRWYPELPKWRNNSGHRALGDIRGSIDELSYYRENVFLENQ